MAEGLWQIFSRTGIPKTILSDQGTQIFSQLLRELCQLTGIEQFRTSPYHPQCNGIIERMHSTFNPFVLFVLRQMPGWKLDSLPLTSYTGFRVRTALDALYHGIYERPSEDVKVCEWIERLTDRLECIREVATLNAAKSREVKVAQTDKGSKMRCFEVNDIVLYRIPGRQCKLTDSWEGQLCSVE